MTYNLNGTRGRVDAATYDAGLRSFMLSVFNNMTFALLISGLVAFLTFQSPGAMHFLFETNFVWVTMLSPLLFLFVLMYGITNLSTGTARTLFWLYAAFMGLSLSCIGMQYTGLEITKVFFISAGTFAGCSAFGYLTGKDLSSIGSYCIMALWGVILASVVNLFFMSGVASLGLSIITVILFVGLTAWDTQQLKDTYLSSRAFSSDDEMSRVGLFGALNLYLDFLNLFLNMLRIFGVSKD